jgi:hypothetical protein
VTEHFEMEWSVYRKVFWLPVGIVILGESIGVLWPGAMYLLVVGFIPLLILSGVLFFWGLCLIVLGLRAHARLRGVMLATLLNALLTMAGVLLLVLAH